MNSVPEESFQSGDDSRGLKTSIVTSFLAEARGMDLTGMQRGGVNVNKQVHVTGSVSEHSLSTQIKNSLSYRTPDAFLGHFYLRSEQQFTAGSSVYPILCFASASLFHSSISPYSFVLHTCVPNRPLTFSVSIQTGLYKIMS